MNMHDIVIVSDSKYSQKLFTNYSEFIANDFECILRKLAPITG